MPEEEEVQTSWAKAIGVRGWTWIIGIVIAIIVGGFISVYYAR